MFMIFGRTRPFVLQHVGQPVLHSYNWSRTVFVCRDRF